MILSRSKISVLVGEHSAQTNVKNMSPKIPPGTQLRLRQLTWMYLLHFVHSKPSAVMSTTDVLQYLQVLFDIKVVDISELLT